MASDLLPDAPSIARCDFLHDPPLPGTRRPLSSGLPDGGASGLNRELGTDGEGPDETPRLLLRSMTWPHSCSTRRPVGVRKPAGKPPLASQASRRSPARAGTSICGARLPRPAGEPCGTARRPLVASQFEFRDWAESRHSSSDKGDAGPWPTDCVEGSRAKCRCRVANGTPLPPH